MEKKYVIDFQTSQLAIIRNDGMTILPVSSLCLALLLIGGSFQFDLPLFTYTVGKRKLYLV